MVAGAADGPQQLQNPTGMGTRFGLRVLEDGSGNVGCRY